MALVGRRHAMAWNPITVSPALGSVLFSKLLGLYSSGSIVLRTCGVFPLIPDISSEYSDMAVGNPQNRHMLPFEFIRGEKYAKSDLSEDSLESLRGPAQRTPPNNQQYLYMCIVYRDICIMHSLSGVLFHSWAPNSLVAVAP